MTRLQRYLKAISKAVPNAVVHLNTGPLGAAFHRNGGRFLIREVLVKNGFVLGEESIAPALEDGVDDLFERNVAAVVRYYESVRANVEAQDLTIGNPIVTVREESGELLVGLFIATLQGETMLPGAEDAPENQPEGLDPDFVPFEFTEAEREGRTSGLGDHLVDPPLYKLGHADAEGRPVPLFPAMAVAEANDKAVDRMLSDTMAQMKGAPVAVRGQGPDQRMTTCPSPRHEDRNPSCTVYLKTMSYHCWGCGAHGELPVGVIPERETLQVQAPEFVGGIPTREHLGPRPFTQVRSLKPIYSCGSERPVAMETPEGIVDMEPTPMTPEVRECVRGLDMTLPTMRVPSMTLDVEGKIVLIKDVVFSHGRITSYRSSETLPVQPVPPEVAASHLEILQGMAQTINDARGAHDFTVRLATPEDTIAFEKFNGRDVFVVNERGCSQGVGDFQCWHSHLTNRMPKTEVTSL